MLCCTTIRKYLELLSLTRFLKYFLTNLRNPFQFLTLLFLRVMGATRILPRQVMFLRSEKSLGSSWASCSQIHYCLLMSLCPFPAAVTLRPPPMAIRCQRLLRHSPLCSPLLPVCRRAQHPLPAGRLKGCVQRQRQAGPVLTVADPSSPTLVVCMRRKPHSGPLPLTSRRSLAGWGGEAVLPYRSRSRSFALAPVRLPSRARAHACTRSVFCTPALHCTMQRGSVVSAPGSNRGLTHWLT